MEIIKFKVTGPEGITEITDQIKDYVERHRIKDGLIMLQTPEKTAAVTFADPLDKDIEKEYILKMNKVLPRYDGMRFSGWSSMNIKASFVGQSLQLMVQQGSPVFGLHQGVFALDFGGGSEEHIIFISHIGTTLAEGEMPSVPAVLEEYNTNLAKAEAQQKAEEEQAVREMREEYNARLKYLEEHPEDKNVRSDREL